MSVFPTAAHLASWAAVVPGCNESAGRVKSATTRPGNRHLKAALGVAALSAARSKDTYYNARYRRIAGTHRPATSHRRKARSPSVPALIAVVAVEHSMLIDAWNMVVNGAFYHDPGADYSTRHHPGQTKAKAIKQLQALGYTVTLEPLTHAAQHRGPATHPLRVTAFSSKTQRPPFPTGKRALCVWPRNLTAGATQCACHPSARAYRRSPSSRGNPAAAVPAGTGAAIGAGSS